MSFKAKLLGFQSWLQLIRCVALYCIQFFSQECEAQSTAIKPQRHTTVSVDCLRAWGLDGQLCGSFLGSCHVGWFLPAPQGWVGKLSSAPLVSRSPSGKPGWSPLWWQNSKREKPSVKMHFKLMLCKVG